MFNCCILLKFYIKPQHNAIYIYVNFCCILLKFYIKPQRSLHVPLPQCCCILLKFYIKPQLSGVSQSVKTVVSYWNSTSNHNCAISPNARRKLYLIEILHQTTTSSLRIRSKTSLYLIEILHQTTTIWRPIVRKVKLYLIEILHQTTTLNSARKHTDSVVSYWNSTSNHNAGGAICSISVLYAVLSGRKIECRTFVEVCLMRFFVFQRTKIPFFQKNSNCCGMSGFARSLLPQKLRMSPYCLSVTDRILVNPAGGIDRRTRLMWTCMFSFEAQCLTYTEYCIIVKPSFSNALRNCAAWRRSVLVLVGRSKKTNNHMIR